MDLIVSSILTSSKSLTMKRQSLRESLIKGGFRPLCALAILLSAAVVLGQGRVTAAMCPNGAIVVRPMWPNNTPVPFRLCHERTPKGSEYDALELLDSQFDLTEVERNALDGYYTVAYPLASFISSSTRAFNCHKYAFGWHPAPLWIDSPSSNWSDGSFLQVRAPGGPYFTTSDFDAWWNGGWGGMPRAVWFGPSVAEHSAWLYDLFDVPGGYLASGISKWGSGPVMGHYFDYYSSPYYPTSLAVFRHWLW